MSEKMENNAIATLMNAQYEKRRDSNIAEFFDVACEPTPEPAARRLYLYKEASQTPNGKMKSFDR